MRLPRGLRSAGLAIAAAACVTFAFARFADMPLLRGLETAALDLHFRLRGVRPPGPEASIVLVDDKSLAALGRWPFSRTLFARALAVLDRADAKVIAFDLLFAEPDEPVPTDLRAAADAAAKALAPGSTLRAPLARLADSDRDGRFAAAMRASGNVLLPVGFAYAGPAGKEPDWLARSAYLDFAKSPLPPDFPLRPVSALLPIARLGEAALGLGHTSLAYDVDGAPRYDYAALPYAGDFLPSLPIRAAAQYLGVPWAKVRLAPGAGVEIGRRMVPTDRAMRLLINYRGPRGTFPTFSFADLLAEKVPRADLAGRIVLIGASFVGSPDSLAQPFGSTPMPGVERLADIIDTIVAGDFIAEPGPLGRLAVMTTVLLLAAFAGGATEFLPTRFAALAAAAPLLAWAGAAQFAFERDFWLPAAGPFAALAAAAASVLLFRYWVVDRDGRRVRAAFRQYLAPELVAVLAEHPERLRLGGETRPLTIMFCDIRGFTAISEGYKSNPSALTGLINRFLSPMSDIVMTNGGTIDKYMGDCIMAFWNAPLDDPEHADRACAAALAMLDGLDRLNRELEAEAAPSAFQPLRIGIGINSGECVVGNMGSTRRFDYSVLGDAVNLASRLEGQSKTYGVPIVIGEATRAAAPGWATVELDRIAVKGKHEAIAIHALLGDAAHARSPEFAALAQAHNRLLCGYRAQDWAGAAEALAQARKLDARLAALYDLYKERLRRFAAEPPGPSWDGIFVALEK
ncbi:MAG TPA: adenylate/guanylate cyclase domain-containing protein [Stellaceae bacterium]|nr:adenylate/guanylate cyclase domain-containing protein [Stellaceae bacterium]